MSCCTDADSELVSHLETIVGRMQEIQRAIKAVGAPPSRLELAELKELGLEYAHVIDRLKGHQGDHVVDD